MDTQSVKEVLKVGDELPSSVDSLPEKFYDPLIMHCVHIDLIEPGRLICSMKVPLRLVNTGNFLHGGATVSLVDIIGSAVIFTTGASTSGVSVEINISSYLDAAFLDEEIEIEAKVIRSGKTIAVVNVDIRKKEIWQLVAQARHTKYLAVSSKL